MRRHNDYDTGRKVYVGPYLDAGVTSEELRELFSKHGSIQTIWVARNPPGFAFVTFEDAKDAEDACRALDGTEYGGKRVRVEVAHGPRSNRMHGDRNPTRERSRSNSPAERRRRSPSYGMPHYGRGSSPRGRSPGRGRYGGSRRDSPSPLNRRDEGSRRRRRSNSQTRDQGHAEHEGGRRGSRREDTKSSEKARESDSPPRSKRSISSGRK